MADLSRLESARQEQSNASTAWHRSPLALVAGILLFLGALALVVLSVTGGDDTADGVDQTSDPAVQIEPVTFGGVNVPETDAVTLTGAALPPLGDDGADAAVGMEMPQITATSLANGNPITLGPGRARVIGFFAHWCPHCQAELPEIVDWMADNRLPPNTEFIAVSTAVDEEAGNYPPSKWFTDVGFTSPVVVDDANATLLNGLGFSGFPAFIAVDSSGVVVARAGGNIGTEGLESLFSTFAS